MSELEPDFNARLTDADLSALDRLIESGFDAPADADARTRRVAHLLALLGAPVAGERDRTTRVSLTDVRSRLRPGSTALIPEDIEALDIWMRHDAARPPAAMASRVDRHESLAKLASDGPAHDASSRRALIERTLASVAANEAQRSRRMKFEDEPVLTGWRMRLADVVSVAAMLLIGASVALPAFQAVRRHQERTLCMNNMQATARAMGVYGGSNADMLPMATAGFGGSWMDVGTPNRSNSANLYTLVRTDYADLADLACPGNQNAPHGDPVPGAWDWRSIDELSYSYRIMPSGGVRITMAVPTTDGVVVMADRSPVTLRAVRGLPVFPESNSPNHAGRGQHVLRLDGSASWVKSPVVNNDNIWLPHPIEQALHHFRSQLGLIEGTEMPASETDAFVGP